MPVDYNYLAQKLDQARASLLPPHSQGVQQAFVDAFTMCRIVDDDLAALGDEHASRWATTILACLDTKDAPPDPRGLFYSKVAGMSDDELREFSLAVDELATWLLNLRASPVRVAISPMQ